MNCSHEEAWEHVKVHVAQLMADQPRNSRKTMKSMEPRPAAPSRETPVPVGRAPRTSSEPFLEVAGGRCILHLNGAQLANAQALVPREILQQCNDSILQAISEGLIELADEHPDAAVLRASAPTALDLGLFDPVRNAAMAAIQQKQYKFPFHDPNVRIMPTDLNKTSLFHVASNNTPRRFCRDEPLGRIGASVSVTYRGEELRHDDELIFMQLLHVARGKYPYEWIYVENVPFFRGSRGVNRILSGKDVTNVEASLKRLRGALLCIESRTGLYTVNLVKEWSTKGSQNRVVIDPVMVMLYLSFTAMDTDHLFQTTGVARQLLKYICTIPANYGRTHPIKIRSLFELCYGTLEALERYYREANPDKSEAKVRIAMSKKLSDFRRKNLRAGLEALKQLRVIVDFTINEEADKVVIVRTLDGAPGLLPEPGAE